MYVYVYLLISTNICLYECKMFLHHISYIHCLRVFFENISEKDSTSMFPHPIRLEWNAPRTLGRNYLRSGWWRPHRALGISAKITAFFLKGTRDLPQKIQGIWLGKLGWTRILLYDNAPSPGKKACHFGVLWEDSLNKLNLNKWLQQRSQNIRHRLDYAPISYCALRIFRPNFLQ